MAGQNRCDSQGKYPAWQARLNLFPAIESDHASQKTGSKLKDKSWPSDQLRSRHATRIVDAHPKASIFQEL